jgi:acetoacetyl-CoA synthetase
MDTSVIGDYCRWLKTHKGLVFNNYRDLWRWSVTDLAGFWQSIAEFFALDLGSPQAVLENPALPGAQWFRGSALSYTEHILKATGSAPALIGHSQTRERVEISRDQLRAKVASCAAGLKALGIKKGDPVAGYMPNIPETAIAFLAVASLGAIWLSCPPEFGARAVIDRFGLVKPKLLFAVAGYRYGDKSVDRRDQLDTIRAAIADIEQVVNVPYLPGVDVANAIDWADLVDSSAQSPAEVACEKVPFDHPLYVLFSSGTSGLPKAIVHGHGGVLLEHSKAIGLHHDVRAGDRFFWYSTTGWMLWNFDLSVLLRGAAMISFDGNPLWPNAMAMWQLAAEEQATFFGNSAPFHTTCRNRGLTPSAECDLSAIRGIGSTGAPLPEEVHLWLAEQFAEEVVIASVSGGTDVCSGMLGASPIVPIRAGELASAMLGCAIASFDKNGKAIIGEPGELVITQPMPSMPVCFWGDDGSRFHSAYFEQNPGVWTHGDWITVFDDGAAIISGRSDATLNRGGVRLGTSDFYNLVEDIDGIADSLVVHIESSDGGLGRLILFVVAAAKDADKNRLDAEIRHRLKEELSPRHIPDKILWLSAIPRTLTGKKLEAPVKNILKGASLDSVASRDSIINAQALDEVVGLKALALSLDA